MPTAPTNNKRGLSRYTQPLAIDSPSCGYLGFALIDDQLLDGDAQLLYQPAGNVRARNMMLVLLHLDNGGSRDAGNVRQSLYSKAAPLAPVLQLIFQIPLVFHGPLLRLIRLKHNCKAFLKEKQLILVLLLLSY